MTLTFDKRKALTLNIFERYLKLQFEPPAALDEIAHRKLRVLIQHSLNSSWWRQRIGFEAKSLLNKQDIKSVLAELPSLTRSDIQQNLDWIRIWIKDSKPQDYVELSTSGSTGQPVSVKQYLPIYQMHYGANELLDAHWQKRDLSRNLGFFRISEPEIRERSLGEPFVFLGGNGQLISRKIIGTTPRDLLKTLVEHNAPYLSVNGMVQRLLAIEQLSNPVQGLRLEQLLNWADPVSPELRSLVREAFGAKIVDRYSSNEFGYLALQCPENDHLHALQVNNYIEILDKNNQPVVDGQAGRVVVTALNNFSQPMIRYELGDFAAWGEKCSAGITFPVLEPKIVRERDMHTGENGEIIVPHPDAIQVIKSGQVSMFQIFRFADAIFLLAAAKQPLSELDIEGVLSDLKVQFNLPLRYEFVPLPAELAGDIVPWKTKRVIRVDAPSPEKVDARVLLTFV